MNEELRFHIDRYAADLVASGLSAQEANRRARIEFGALNTVQDGCREARGLRLFDQLSFHIRHAVRSLLRTPGFTATVLLTLAICAGANLTIFAVIDSVLLKPLPFPDADRLVFLYNTYPKAGVDRDGSSLTNYYERRGHIPAFSSLSIYAQFMAIVGGPGRAQRQEVTEVSPEFFATLGAGPAIGRAFTEAETNYENNNSVILTDRYWRQHFHSDPHVLGAQIRVDGRPLTVVGVLPRSFRFLSSEASIYVPLASSLQARLPAERHSGGNFIQMIARLRNGFTIAQAQAEVDAQNAALEKDDPKGKAMADAGFRSMVVSLHADHVASIRPVLLLLQGGVLLLLLIGTVNLANLLLIRASTNAKEAAVRQALGASRLQVLLEALLETSLLSVMGGLLGLVLAAAGIRLLLSLGADRLPLGSQIQFDARLAVVAIAASVLLGIVLAAPIGWLNARSHLDNTLKSETRGGHPSRAAQRLRHGFTIAQIALSFVLLAGAGLLGLGLERAMSISPGFQPDHVLSAQVALVGSKYPTPETGLNFSERLVSQLDEQAGVAAAGVINNIPFSGRSGKTSATVVGYTLRPGEPPRANYGYGVAGDYFRAMGLSLIEGRFLVGADSRRTQRVCVVDRDFAQYYWPHGSALGHRLFEGAGLKPDREAFTIVGVVSSAKQAGLTDETALGSVYYPYGFMPDNHLYVVARSAGRADALARTLESVVRRIDPDLTLDDVRSMDERISDSLITRRSPALLAALFSAVALLLTGIGVYGVLSYSVAQRRREIGVRMALGARPERIRSHFLLIAFKLLLAGTAIGMLGAFFAGRAMSAVLFHVSAFDAPTLIGACAVVCAVSLCACMLPARRASRISPSEALAEN